MAETRAALIIAVSEYQDAGLRQLVAPAQDAQALARVLEDPTIGGFAVKTLLNQPAHQVNRDIEAFFANRHKDDLLLLYFSGHGLRDNEEGRLYFATTDTDRKFLRSTAVAATWLNEVMYHGRSRRQVLILDCCYSGAFARGMIHRGDETVGTGEYFREGRGQFVLTASDALQYAFEGDAVQGAGLCSVFTEILVQGLETGAADRDQDGYISCDELYDYLHEHVIDHLPQQRPRKWAFGVEGDLIIARNPRPIIKPAIQSIHDCSAPQVQTLQQQTAQALGLTVEFRDSLKDGSSGPLMVVIPGGRFLMGSPKDEPGHCNDERQHEVEVKPFAVGKYIVTFEEYDYFAKVTRRYKPSDQGQGRGRRPVINVDWHDAVAYAQWLSEETGKHYRLPTEAEWEYACRAGTITTYYFGTAINPDLANYYSGGFLNALGALFGKTKTVPVGCYPANAWGLHDMHGNVWEWTSSVYSKNYDGSEQRCAEPGTSGPRVMRGGSWCNAPRWLCGAARDGDTRLYCGGYTNGGFRLARTFP